MSIENVSEGLPVLLFAELDYEAATEGCLTFSFYDFAN
jgi:hypothetical protein